MEQLKTTRREFLAGLGAFMLLPLVPGCATRPPLRIAVYPWPGYELLFLARREGWLSEQQVRLVETGSTIASVQAVMNGTADGACLTLDELLRARENGIALTAVLVCDISAGGDQILARPGIASIRQLAGKRVGVEQSAGGELLLHLALHTVGMDGSQVTMVPVTPDNCLTLWQSGAVDALVCYEPIASKLHSMGAQTIFDSRGLPEMIVDLLAVKTDLLSRYHRPLKGLVNAHFMARRHLMRNPQDAAYKLADRLTLPVSGVLDVYRGVELPNVSANRHYLEGDKAHLLDSARTLMSIMQQHRLLKKAVSLERLFDARFLPDKDV